MQYRLDKKANKELSALGFGCMRFPMSVGGIDKNLTKKLIEEALAQGINYFDTAYLYPGSEAALGEILEELGARENVFVATKLAHMRCKSVADVDRMFQVSCKRLRTTYIDYFLIHNITSAAQWERLVSFGILDWVRRVKESGAVRNIGFSFHGPLPEFEKMLELYDWDFCQIQYNYINVNYQAGEAGLKMAAERNMPVIIMEPLLGGKLAANLPSRAESCFKEANSSRSAAAWALRWLWDQPEVTVVLSGMNSIDQLLDNCNTVSDASVCCMNENEQAVIEAVREEFNKTYRIPCTGCNYCMPCPKGINIPAAFASYNESFSMGWFTGVMHYCISAGVPTSELHFSSDCIECGACSKKCPQSIAVPDSLKQVRKRLQPPGLASVARVIGKVVRS